MTKEPGSAYLSREVAGDDRTSRLETALRRSEKLALAGRLAASVMHEINNPSQAISDLVYLIGKEADRPDLVRARAAQIEEQLVRIQYIARQTLSYFRETPQVQTKDLVPLVESALRFHSGLMQEKRIHLSRALPDTLLAAIYPGDFLQLVSNLVRNAVEALPAEGTLYVRLRAVRTRRGTEARLTIADNGRGIPSSIKSHLFEAFQTDKAEAGNGLGLWICKTIIEKHDGRIRYRTCSSGERHGTAFTVVLPLEKQAELQVMRSAS